MKLGAVTDQLFQLLKAKSETENAMDQCKLQVIQQTLPPPLHLEGLGTTLPLLVLEGTHLHSSLGLDYPLPQTRGHPPHHLSASHL